MEDLTLAKIRDFKGLYPRQLWYLFMSEMWERFSYYGMRGMLVVFMTDKLGFAEDAAQLQYGASQTLVYAFAFVGGFFADKILGYRKSLFWGGLLMIAGSVIMAIDPQIYLFPGLGVSIIGTAFFKPNISTIVGNLYHDNDHRIDAGFSLFYAGINLGGVLGGYFCVAIGKQAMLTSIVPAAYSWNVAFGLAALVMTISLLTFTQTQKTLGPIGKSPLLDRPVAKRRRSEWLTYIGSLVAIPLIILMVSNTKYTDIFTFIVGPASIVYLVWEMRNYSAAENKKLIAALLLMLFSVFFWAFFEQSGGSLSVFANKNLDDNLLGMKLDPNGVNNSANSFFVIALSSLFGLLWVWLNKRKLEPNTAAKFGLAFLFLGLGFVTFYLTQKLSNEKGITSLNVFTVGWLIITFGELCLSPIGMSTMTKLSPVKLQGVIMGMWFLASAYGQYFAGLLGANISRASLTANNYEKMVTYTNGYAQLGWYSLILGGLIIVFSPLIRRMMGNVK